MFDVSRSSEEKQAGIAHLADPMRASSAMEPLMMIFAGGVRIRYAGLMLAMEQSASAEALRSLVFLPHGTATEMTARKDPKHPEYAPNWPRLKELSPESTFIDHTPPRVNGRRDGGVIQS